MLEKYKRQFEEHTPKWKRVGKYILTLVIICLTSHFINRITAMILLGVFFLPAVYIHAYYLPKKKGINGWTGEPKEKYYELRGWDKTKL